MAEGQIKRYVPCEENRGCLKGKLLLPDHLRLNQLHQERFFTACDEFTCDNIVSQLLKAALRKCRDQKVSNLVAQKAKSLMPDFDEVSDVRLSDTEIKSILVDRRISRFEPLLNMAKLHIEEVSPAPSASGHAVYSLMFDMNEVFERFIAAEMKAAMRHEPVSVNYQVKGKSLLRRNGLKRFALRPDMGIFQKQEYMFSRYQVEIARQESFI